MENKKKIWIIVAVVVIIGLLIWWGVAQKASKKVEQVGPGGTIETMTPTSTPEVTTPEEAEKPKPIETPLGTFDVVAPLQTMPLAPEKVEDVIAKGEAIKLVISPDGFTPKEFTVKAGQVVSLILEAQRATHTFGFESPELADIYMGVALGETRGLSFTAPTKKGDYKFFCTQPGHKERGEVGVMHVN